MAGWNEEPKATPSSWSFETHRRPSPRRLRRSDRYGRPPGRGHEVHVRMGLHSGEGIPGGDDYVGVDVNRAARIAAAAHGDQVSCSESTRALRVGPSPMSSSCGTSAGTAPGSGRTRTTTSGYDRRPSNRVSRRHAAICRCDLICRLRTTSFIGRETELDRLQDLVAERAWSPSWGLAARVRPRSPRSALAMQRRPSATASGSWASIRSRIPSSWRAPSSAPSTCET